MARCMLENPTHNKSSTIRRNKYNSGIELLTTWWNTFVNLKCNKDSFTSIFADIKTSNRKMKTWMTKLLIYVLRFCSNAQALRFLVDTTCLELAKPINELYRLSCSDPYMYHCLPTEGFTREVEICRHWKYISKGKRNHVNSVKNSFLIICGLL